MSASVFFLHRVCFFCGGGGAWWACVVVTGTGEVVDHVVLGVGISAFFASKTSSYPPSWDKLSSSTNPGRDFSWTVDLVGFSGPTGVERLGTLFIA